MDVSTPNLTSTNTNSILNTQLTQSAPKQNTGINQIANVKNYVFRKDLNGKTQLAIKDGNIFKHVVSAMPYGKMQCLFMDLKSLNKKLNNILQKLADNKKDFKQAVAESKKLVDGFCKSYPKSSNEIVDHLYIDLSYINSNDIDLNKFKKSLAKTCKNLDNLNQQIKKNDLYPSVFKQLFLIIKSFFGRLFSFLIKTKQIDEKNNNNLVIDSGDSIKNEVLTKKQQPIETNTKIQQKQAQTARVEQEHVAPKKILVPDEIDTTNTKSPKELANNTDDSSTNKENSSSQEEIDPLISTPVEQQVDNTDNDNKINLNANGKKNKDVIVSQESSDTEIPTPQSQPQSIKNDHDTDAIKPKKENPLAYNEANLDKGQKTDADPEDLPKQENQDITATPTPKQRNIKVDNHSNSQTPPNIPAPYNASLSSKLSQLSTNVTNICNQIPSILNLFNQKKTGKDQADTDNSKKQSKQQQNDKNKGTEVSNDPLDLTGGELENLFTTNSALQSSSLKSRIFNPIANMLSSLSYIGSSKSNDFKKAKLNLTNNNSNGQPSTANDLSEDAIVNNDNDEDFDANKAGNVDENSELDDTKEANINEGGKFYDHEETNTNDSDDEYHESQEQTENNSLTSSNSVNLSTTTDDEHNIVVQQPNVKPIFEAVKEYVKQKNTDNLPQFINKLTLEEKYNLFKDYENSQDVLDALIPLIDAEKDIKLIGNILFNFVKDPKYNFVINKLIEKDNIFANLKKDKNKSTFLMEAIKHDNQDIIEQLINISSKKVLDEQDDLGNTALIYAMEAQKTRATFLLTKKGANIYTKNNNGKSAFELKDTSPDTIKNILNEKHQENQEIITNYLIEGKFDFIKTSSFEELGANLYSYSEKENNILSQVILRLKDLKINLSDDIVSRIIEKTDAIKNKANKDGTTPLHHSIACSNHNVFLKLIDAGADINAIDNLGNNSLMYAAQIPAENQKSEDIIRYLVRQNIDINAQNNNGFSAFTKAANTNNTLAFDILMEQKDLNINLQNKTGRSALMYAIRHGNKDMINQLIKKGADVNLKSEDGNNALMHALATIKKNNVTCDCCAQIMTAMEQNSDKGKAAFNSINKDGDTPLILAVKNGSSYAVQLLTDLSVVDIDVKNNAGERALDIAKKLADQARGKPAKGTTAFFAKNYKDILEHLQKCEINRKSGNTLAANAQGLLSDNLKQK